MAAASSASSRFTAFTLLLMLAFTLLLAFTAAAVARSGTTLTSTAWLGSLVSSVSASGVASPSGSGRMTSGRARSNRAAASRAAQYSKSALADLGEGFGAGVARDRGSSWGGGSRLSQPGSRPHCQHFASPSPSTKTSPLHLVQMRSCPLSAVLIISLPWGRLLLAAGVAVYLYSPEPSTFRRNSLPLTPGMNRGESLGNPPGGPSITTTHCQIRQSLRRF